jgi:predicted NBD/HSP70 family sugar kinase
MFSLDRAKSGSDDSGVSRGEPLTLRLRGNERRIADALRRLGPATRAELGAITRLSRATVSAGLSALVEAGLVVETGEAVPVGPAGGRPPGLVRLAPAAGLAVGVDVGRTHLRVAVADLGHQVLGERSMRFERGKPAGEVIDAAADLVGSELCAAGVRLADVIGVGLGLPAPLDQRSGRISWSSILPEWAGLAAGDELAARLGRPVIVDNDANLGALAEALWGAGRGIDTLVYVKVATGIGAGLVLDGRLFRGVSGQAGEIGHFTLDEHGEVCRCGNRGCLELVAGGAALVAALRRTHGELDSVEDVVALAVAGDAAARRMIADAGEHLGVAAGGLVNLVNPQRLILGGELSRAGDLLLEPLRRALRRSAVRPAADAVDVVGSELDDRSEVLGAVAVVLHEFDRARAVPAAAH